MSESPLSFTRQGFPKPSHPTLRGRIERLFAPGYGYCLRCGRPFNRDIYHSTDYGGFGGCFPLCKGCWASLTPRTRLPYYDRLVDEWIRQAPGNLRDEYEQKRHVIRAAVVSGG